MNEPCSPGRRFVRSTLIACALFSAPVALTSARASPATAPTVAQGRYVAVAADCVSCHTDMAHGGRDFAGGRGLGTAFGTLYSSNITPDVATGIGSWSEADFDRALRRGVRKDGEYLYPAMPYQNFTRMSAADMHALWLYMRSLPPVRNKVPDTTLRFPYTLREGLFLWQSLFFQPGLFKPDLHKGREWNRGAYLVQALAHCAQCHTPRNYTLNLRTQNSLTGAWIQGWYAPNISGDPLSTVERHSTQDLLRFFRTGTMPGNAPAVGPMHEVVHDSLSRLTDSDRKAIVLYLKDQSPVPQLAPLPVKWPRQAIARSLYMNHCSSCHQADGKGIPRSVPALAGNDAVTAAEPYNVLMAMLEGLPPHGTWGAMGSFEHLLSDADMADIANYVRTSWGNSASPNATPWMVEVWRFHESASSQKAEHALLCPEMRSGILLPAMARGPAALEGAATDRAKMRQLMSGYEAAVPQATHPQVLEALSAAYCRVLAGEHLSRTRMIAQLDDFAEQEAEISPASGSSGGSRGR